MAQVGSNPEALAELINALQQKVNELSQSRFTPDTVQRAPIFRCLVVLGHEFQNFPSETYKVFKVKSQPGQDNRNIVKWIL